jgi:hypothetical protein
LESGYKPQLALGETYIGSYDQEGKVVHLILLPDAEKVLTWPGALGWAQKKGASLPNIAECRLLRADFYDEFLEAIYWTCETMPETPGASPMAWAFCFDKLGLLPELSSQKRYARLVRRETEK